MNSRPAVGGAPLSLRQPEIDPNPDDPAGPIGKRSGFEQGCCLIQLGLGRRQVAIRQGETRCDRAAGDHCHGLAAKVGALDPAIQVFAREVQVVPLVCQLAEPEENPASDRERELPLVVAIGKRAFVRVTK